MTQKIKGGLALRPNEAEINNKSYICVVCRLLYYGRTCFDIPLNQQFYISGGSYSTKVRQIHQENPNV